MNRTALPAVLVPCLLLPAMVAGGFGAPAAGGLLPGVSARDTSWSAGQPSLFPNVSFPTHTMAAQDWYEQGFALTSEERYAEAVTAYEQAIAADHALLNAWYYLGDAFFRLGRYQEALLAFGNATAIDPDFVDAYFYESLVYRQLGLPREEKAALGQGLDAADRKKAKEETRSPGGSGGQVSGPVSYGAAILGAGAACALRFLRQREKR
ncbi:MAG TPA: tetratricopeptide repeat protein [Methanomicrobiales archaeon]|nr:tetratricopeptide repeat protein [Methanomicrobiales archaeon]